LTSSIGASDMPVSSRGILAHLPVGGSAILV
jgi:hypothetical protein